MSKKQSRMPGLRQRNGIWHIEKRCRYAPGGWLHESTGTSSRVEAERILIRRLANLEEEARRQTDAVFLFEQAALRYLEEVAGARPERFELPTTWFEATKTYITI